MHRSTRGISFAEFTISVTLLGVVLLLTAPLLYRISKDQRASHYANELVATLTYARAQAVNRAQPVTICASQNGRECSDTPWGNGYLVFVDAGTPGVVDAGDKILRHVATNNPKVMITLEGGAFVRFNAFGNLVAQASGEAAQAPVQVASWLERLSPIGAAHAETYRTESAASNTDATHPGAFTVCYRDIGRTISLSRLGRISTRTASCHKSS